MKKERKEKTGVEKGSESEGGKAKYMGGKRDGRWEVAVWSAIGKEDRKRRKKKRGKKQEKKKSRKKKKEKKKKKNKKK